MTTTILAPMDLAAPTRSGPRVYRKQVLKKGTINYPMPDGSKRVVTFDDDYLRDLADAYTGGAYDLVPFQLADPQNKHNEDPHNYGGRVLGAEVTPTGLDLILELAEDTAELVERTGRRLGVSARIKEHLEHVDGRKFKRAIRHVLGTLDPRMTGMSPWEPVDLSHNESGEVLDLSDLTYTEDRTMARLNLSALPEDDAERALALMAAAGIDLSAAYDDDGDPDEPGGDDEPDLSAAGADELDTGDEPEADLEDRAEIEPITDDELDALLDSAIADAAGVSLSTPDDEPGGDDLALSMSLASDASDVAAVHRRDAATARYELAAERLGAAGVPPHVIELCRPVLELGDTDDALELSSPATGDAIDVRGIVTGLLEAVKGTVDLSRELGHGHEDPAGDLADDTARGWTDYLENN